MRKPCLIFPVVLLLASCQTSNWEEYEPKYAHERQQVFGISEREIQKRAKKYEAAGLDSEKASRKANIWAREKAFFREHSNQNKSYKKKIFFRKAEKTQ